MIDKAWRELFPAKILARGRDYFRSDAVYDLSWKGHTLTACVSGSEEYDVEIDLDGTTVSDSSCTCPYARDGRLCKHMAAVLFAAEDAGLEPESDTVAAFPWRETLAGLSVEELRCFLTVLLETDPKLQQKFALCFGEQEIGDLTESWKTALGKIVRRNANRHGYVEYDHVEDFYTEIDAFLSDQLPVLLQADRTLEAFRLVCMVYETLMENDADEEGALADATAACAQAWRAILEKAPEHQEAMHAMHTNHAILYPSYLRR